MDAIKLSANVDVSALMEHLKNKDGITRKEIQHKLNVSKTRLDNLFYAAGHPRIDTFIKIMNTLGYDVFIIKQPTPAQKSEGAPKTTAKEI